MHAAVVITLGFFVLPVWGLHGAFIFCRPPPPPFTWRSGSSPLKPHGHASDGNVQDFSPPTQDRCLSYFVTVLHRWAPLAAFYGLVALSSPVYQATPSPLPIRCLFPSLYLFSPIVALAARSSPNLGLVPLLPKFSTSIRVSPPVISFSREKRKVPIVRSIPSVTLHLH